MFVIHIVSINAYIYKVAGFESCDLRKRKEKKCIFMLLSYVRIIYQVMAIIKSKYRQQLVEWRNEMKREIIKIKANLNKKVVW